MRPHTGHIAAALLIAWVIFVISRGELPVYLAILGIGGKDLTASQCNQGSVLGNIFGSLPTVTAYLPGGGGIPPIFGSPGCDPSIDPCQCDPTCGLGGDGGAPPIDETTPV